MKTNVLYFGNNLNVLREQIADESIDLCYCDPPFKSNRGFFVMKKPLSRGQRLFARN